jgi:hypothetical protein
MWGINPKLLCDKHLIGEHGEIHKHRHNFVKQHSIAKRISPVVQIEPQNMEIRHNQLAEEMIARGFNHNSPYELPDLSHLSNNELKAEIDIYISISDLSNRCPECHKRISNCITETGQEFLRKAQLIIQ